MTPPASIEQALKGDAEPPKGGTPNVGSSAFRQSALRWRDAALALSIAHFCFIQAWHGLLFQNSFGYFNRIPVNRASVAALLINIFGFGFLLWVAGRWLRRLNRPGLWVAANLGVCALALVPLNFARTHFWNLTAGKFADALKEPLVLASAITVGLLAVWFHRHAAKAVTTAYIILSPMLVFTGGRCAWWLVRPPAAPIESIAAKTPDTLKRPPSAVLLRRTGEHQRVVWILLDELDQRIGFETRPAGVALPELDRLYQECFRATSAFPPGGSTMYSLPALTIGQRVDHAEPASASELSLGPQADGWSATQTVFSRARAMGFSTSLVGWYHPYGRVLGNHLDRCEWRAYPPFEEERGFTVGAALLNQLCAVASQFQQRRLQIRSFLELEGASLNFLTNSPSGLTFLHLPVPHHPGIYDPKRAKLTVWNYSRKTEYLGNLVLADQLFGRLRRAMEQAGTWENTWVIVSSDHWWRDAARIDHRVPFIIKGAGANEPVVYAKPLDTVLTQDLVLAVLRGELTDVTALPKWLDAHAVAPPSGYKPSGQPF